MPSEPQLPKPFVAICNHSAMLLKARQRPGFLFLPLIQLINIYSAIYLAMIGVDIHHLIIYSVQQINGRLCSCHLDINEDLDVIKYSISFF